MNYLFLTGLLAPIWFPLIRLVVSFFQSTRPSKAAIWWYVATLLWSIGWIAFQWVIQVPSGIGYGLALISGWLIMLAAIGTEGIGMVTSGDSDRKEGVSSKFSWTLLLVAGVVVGALWWRHEYRQQNFKIEERLAIEFVKNHSLVSQKGGSGLSPSMVAITKASDGMPLKYEISTRLGYAIVSVVQSASGRAFHLNCTTSLSIGARDLRRDTCEQGLISMAPLPLNPSPPPPAPATP